MSPTLRNISLTLAILPVPFPSNTKKTSSDPADAQPSLSALPSASRSKSTPTAAFVSLASPLESLMTMGVMFLHLHVKLFHMPPAFSNIHAIAELGPHSSSQ